MVADSERNRRYHRAIARAVYSQPEGRRRVLDIGAGSGLLGLIAAKHVCFTSEITRSSSRVL